jgi:hypothetical protein
VRLQVLEGVVTEWVCAPPSLQLENRYCVLANTLGAEMVCELPITQENDAGATTLTPSTTNVRPGGFEPIVTVTVDEGGGGGGGGGDGGGGGAVDVDGYMALTLLISPVDKALRCPMGIPAGIVSMVG